MSDIKENSVSELNEENNEDECIITMVDVLEEEKKLEEDAFAVLGASDDKNCTYNMGYMKRQALYACRSCSVKDRKSAAICLACSFHCHEGHDLIELYTKRNFRCDCGNSLFGYRQCTLEKNKDSVNAGNTYNQNFKGVYCTCARPYPDPEDPVSDEMIQCIVCEDWYHTRHLKCTAVPEFDDYSEMICQNCVGNLPFLQHYAGYTVTKIKKESNDTDDKAISVDDLVTSSASEIKKENCVNDGSQQLAVEDDCGGTEDVKPIANVEMKETCDSNDNKPNPDTLKQNGNVSECKLKNLLGSGDCKKEEAFFCRDGFRNELCKCTSCMDLYSSNGVSFLMDPLDTVQEYEEEGKNKRNTSCSSRSSGYEQGLEALSSLDRVQQVEAIHRYNEMQEHLKEYLAKFAKNNKVVRAEDIKEFFNGMQSRKRQKVDVPHFCH